MDVQLVGRSHILPYRSESVLALLNQSIRVEAIVGSMHAILSEVCNVYECFTDFH